MRKTAGRAGRIARLLTVSVTLRQRPIIQCNVLFKDQSLAARVLPGCPLSTAPNFWFPASRVKQLTSTAHFYMKFRGNGFSCRVLPTVSRFDYISISIVLMVMVLCLYSSLVIAAST